MMKKIMLAAIAVAFFVPTVALADGPINLALVPAFALLPLLIPAFALAFRAS